jgi:uncharacterized integral membrane protein (TIGR00698 family)
MIIATLIGMAVGNSTRLPALFTPGTRLSSRMLLRIAIVLLGLQITAQDLAALGLPGLLAIVSIPAATLMFGLWLGKRLGIAAGLAQLVAMGTAVCGASAIAATHEVNASSGEDVAYGLISITLFGTMSMLAYPLLSAWLGLSPEAAAVWAGASIHEIAQVAGASFQYGPEAGNTGMVVKLARVMMLAPLLMLLAGPLGAARPAADTPAGGKTRRALPVPPFILFFLAVVALNSLVPLPAGVRGAGAMVSTTFMAMALAALGLHANFAKLRLRGLRPLLLGAATTLFIALLALAAVRLLGL